MPSITLNIPDENVALLLELTEVMGITKENITVTNTLPEWHKQVLEERLENYNSNKIPLTSWNDFEKELSNEDEVDDV